MDGRYAVYILASQRNGTLYIGVTSDLPRRVEQHEALAVPGFTRLYAVTTRSVRTERDSPRSLSRVMAGPVPGTQGVCHAHRQHRRRS